jgi:hypothetical protein
LIATLIVFKALLGIHSRSMLQLKVKRAKNFIQIYIIETTFHCGRVSIAVP